MTVLAYETECAGGKANSNDPWGWMWRRRLVSYGPADASQRLDALYTHALSPVPR
jgi:hypothetical protein